MKKIKCLITVPDKHTGKEYKAGTVYTFEDEKRADEILSARTAVTKEPYFEEVVEDWIITEDKEGQTHLEQVERAEVSDLKAFKVDELKEIAKLEGIEGYATMKKAELIEAIENKNN